MKKSDFLSTYQGVAREVLETLLDTYKDEGIHEIETTKVLKLEQFKNMVHHQRLLSTLVERLDI